MITRGIRGGKDNSNWFPVNWAGLFVLSVTAYAGTLIVNAPAIVLPIAGAALLTVSLQLCRLPIFYSSLLLITPIAMGQSGLSPVKIAWIVALAALVFPVIMSDDFQEIRERSLFSSTVYSAALLVAILTLAALVGRGNGGSIGDFARSCSAYLVLALAPFVGACLSKAMKFRQLENVLVLLGLFSACSVSLYWLSGRGIIPLNRLPLFPSASILLTLLFYSLSAYRRSGKLKWGTLAVILIVASVLNGSRTSLVVIAAIVVGSLILGKDKHDRINLAKNLKKVIGILLSVAVAVLMLISINIFDWKILEKRYAGIFSGDANIGTDASGRGRLLFGRFALEMFQHSPIVGFGPGGFEPRFPAWALQHSGTITAMSIPKEYQPDTPLAILPIMGALGLGAVLIFLWRVTKLLRNWDCSTPLQLRDTITLWMAYAILTMPFGAVFDDKTFGIALSILIAMTMRQGQSTENETTTPMDWQERD